MSFNKQDVNRIKKNLFINLAELLNLYKWDLKTVEQAEEQCNLSKGYHYLLFPDGLVEIVQEFEQWQNICMTEKLAKLEKPVKIREQIALALQIKLREVISRPALLNHDSFFLTPANIAYSIKNVWQLCDLIWRYAGDKSVDFNYYSKRSLLAGVYLSAKSVYFSDASEDFVKTQEHIIASLDRIINISRQIHNCRNNYSNSYFKLPKIENIPVLRLFL